MNAYLKKKNFCLSLAPPGLKSCVRPCPNTSLTFKETSLALRGPWMRDLKVPSGTHLSCQRLKSLLLPGIHQITLLKTSLPIFIAFQVLEHGSLSQFLTFNLRFEQYLLLSTLTHNASFSSRNLQFSLANKAWFLPLADWIPKSLSALGLVTLCQPTQWNFFVSSIDPHKKFQLNLSMLSSNFFGSTVHCIT